MGDYPPQGLTKSNMSLPSFGDLAHKSPCSPSPWSGGVTPGEEEKFGGGLRFGRGICRRGLSSAGGIFPVGEKKQKSLVPPRQFHLPPENCLCRISIPCQIYLNPPGLECSPSSLIFFLVLSGYDLEYLKNTSLCLLTINTLILPFLVFD